MSRDTALVTVEWAEKNLNTPGVVFVEVDEDTTAYDGGHIAGAIKLDWKTDLQDPVRRDFVNQEQFEKLLSERGDQQRRHRRPLRRQQQLVRGVRVLVLQAVRPRTTSSCSTAAARSGSWTAASWSTEVPQPAATSYTGQGAGPVDPGVPRRGRRRDRHARTWSTCAARTSTPAGCSPRPTCRRSRRSAAATSRPRSTCRGARPPTRTAPSSPMRSSASCTARPGWTAARTSSRTAGSASVPRTPGSCCTSCSASRT